ncbi:MAG: Fe-S cluster assembly ATPase SufC [Methanocellales archaeon]|nr:Fe-S cluster assembly ATPase SufC [Methanocellales archaeon]MDD3291218.1 Fe-S cluster assembly ATPase SufC [Methanocellales archaeon]MDD5235318.1 Fe-S cluster assembly ATPase SufC [Methanocellales archaeon]MDD5484526.1 Fe-S cluster assembly ATPase SufC [Methanocellales archaeon]
MALLEIKNLHVEVGGKEILKGVNLEIGKGEVHILLGPNASGKTTLVMTILGMPAYKVSKGDIIFDGKDVINLSIDQRAREGIGFAFQFPPAISGVKLRDIIRLCGGKEPWDPSKEKEERFATEALRNVGLPPSFRDRDLNVGFSGGEKKRSELVQIFAMKPKLMILDEPDSGVDIDSLKLIGGRVDSFLKETGGSLLLITHHRHILQYMDSDLAHVMCDGKIVVSDYPENILSKIEEKGYCAYVDVCPPSTKKEHMKLLPEE